MEVIMKREQFGSRLGFILVSAGCAIGLGNVWKFPYMAGKYGGAAFILVYLLFLVILGLPIIVCEFSVGRASQKSIATSYNALEPPRTKWHYARWAAIAGNYLLVMFYSMVGGWMLYYCFRMAKGEFTGVTASEVSENMQACFLPFLHCPSGRYWSSYCPLESAALVCKKVWKRS